MKLSNLGRKLGGHWVVRRVDLEVPHRLHIHGPNGSGKSTLLRLMAGVLRPHEGKTTIKGQPCHDVSAKQHVAWVGQDAGWYDALTAKEHFAWALRLRGQQPDQQVLAAAGLGGLEDKLVGSLSRGQKQRLALAQALASGADYLLLDEPLNHLDSAGQTWLMSALDDYHGNVVMASHQPSAWPQFALEAP